MTEAVQSLSPIRNIDNNNFLDYLSSAYEVLRKIFSYLSVEDLETVSKAFERWKPVVETTKRERTDVETYLVLNNHQKFNPWNEALFCFTFCLNKNKELSKNLKKCLVPNSDFLMIESRSGVIGTSNDLSSLYQQKKSGNGNSSGPAVHLRIPNIPGVGIKIFTWNSNISFQEFKNNYNLPENQIVKCLLILISVQDANNESSEQKDDFVLFLKTSQSEEFAVGGCFIDSFFGDSEENSEIVTTYVVFYGEKVEASSIILKETTITEEEIDLAVKELKLISPKTDKGVLFVFRCCSRNEVSRKSSVRKFITKWEGDSIRKYFPKIPIIGCFGYGEFGRKYPVKESQPFSSKRIKQCDIWEYSFSTSIVYVGFKQ